MAKQHVRDEHIDDTGRSTADHIFAHVPPHFGVDNWHRHGDGECQYDKEHLWRRDDHNALVFMERTRMGWRVDGRGDCSNVEQEFSFEARKSAEAHLVSVMMDE